MNAKIKCDCNKIIRYLFYRHKPVGKKDKCRILLQLHLMFALVLRPVLKKRFKRPAAVKKLTLHRKKYLHAYLQSTRWITCSTYSIDVVLLHLKCVYSYKRVGERAFYVLWWGCYLTPNGVLHKNPCKYHDVCYTTELHKPTSIVHYVPRV